MAKCHVQVICSGRSSYFLGDEVDNQWRRRSRLGSEQALNAKLRSLALSYRTWYAVEAPEQ